MGEQYESEIMEQSKDPMQSLPEVEPRIQRMLIERDELDQRGQKLVAFVRSDGFKLLPEREKYLLTTQAQMMGNYYAILSERIMRAQNPAQAAEYDLKEAQQEKASADAVGSGGTDGNG